MGHFGGTPYSRLMCAINMIHHSDRRSAQPNCTAKLHDKLLSCSAHQLRNIKLEVLSCHLLSWILSGWNFLHNYVPRLIMIIPHELSVIASLSEYAPWVTQLNKPLPLESTQIFFFFYYFMYPLPIIIIHSRPFVKKKNIYWSSFFCSHDRRRYDWQVCRLSPPGPSFRSSPLDPCEQYPSLMHCKLK